MDGEQQREGCYGLLSAAQVAHRLEAFAWCDAVVVDAVQVGFLGVFGAKERLC